MPLPADLGTRFLPENTAVLRWAVTHVPPASSEWTFASHPLAAEESDIISWCSGWADRETPRPAGVVFWGEAGTGKTGLAIAALRVCAERADGDTALWNLLTLAHAQGRAATRVRPAPVWFESWMDLSARLRRARTARWVSGEEYVTEETILEELEERCAVLAVDDIDLGPMTSGKEVVLLSLLRRVERGQRTIFTANVGPKEFMARFGERCADRLLDEKYIALVPLHGRSRRRRDPA